MLRVMRAYAYRAWIAVLNLDVDITHCRIERAGARIWRRGISDWSPTREEKHVRGTLLKARRVGGENECRAPGAESDQPDSGPDVDGSCDPVSAGRNKHDPLLPGLLNLVDRLLYRSRIVSEPIAFHREVFAG